MIEAVEVGPVAEAWFTGRDPEATERPLGPAGNVAHRRPHRPLDLAADRAAVGAATATDPERWHLMQQVHGTAVGVVDADTPPGAELPGVDVIVTREPQRPLGVQVADCVPLLLADATTVAAVHAGRRGVADGVVAAALAALAQLGAPASRLTAVIGPAIGGCCYELPRAQRDEVLAALPAPVADAAATTTRAGTPGLDLAAAVAAELSAAGVDVAHQSDSCTRCDPAGRWFSHRADPSAGRQLGLVVRRGEGGRAPGRAARTEPT